MAQSPFSLQVQWTDSVTKQRLPSYPHTFKTSWQRDKALEHYLFRLYDDGYLAASIDSTSGDSLHRVAWLYRGQPYTWINIGQGNVQDNFLGRSGYRQKLFYHEPLRFDRVQRLEQKLLQQYENNGYPFARIRLQDVTVKDATVNATLHADTGPLVRIDSIVTEGKGRIAPAYLYSYLGIRPGKPYNEAAVRNIESRLKGLPFLAPAQKPIVEFRDDKAIIRLVLDKRNANQFYGVLGIVPQSDLNGGVLITGDVKLRLHNLLKRGELLDVQWQRLQTATQNLKVMAQYPFLFNTPIGLEGKFDFFRVDTAFFTINLQASVMYLMQGIDYVKLYYNFQTSRKVLPEDGQATMTGLANTDMHSYGLGFQRERLDYRFNPRKGYWLQFNGAIGTKNILATPQDTINPVDSLTALTVQGNLTGSVDGFIPIWKFFTIRLAGKAGWQINPYLFRNELYRIGGLRTVRGFDEESIYCSMYAFGSLEFRYLFDENSYVNIFADAGYYERGLRNEYFASYMAGFGAGLTFATKIGSFTVNYALGTQRNSPIDFRRSKIHFGYVNYF